MSETSFGHEFQERCFVRGEFDVKWLALVWLGKTENSDEDLCGDEHGVRKCWRGRMLTSLLATFSIPSQGVRSQRAVRHHPWTSRLGHTERIDQNVNTEEASQEKVQDAATQLGESTTSAGDESKESCCCRTV